MSELNLLERLEIVENRNRYLRKVSMITFVMSFLLFAFTVCQFLGLQTLAPKALYAKSFYVQDAKGNIQAELSHHDNVTMFSIYDQNNKPRLALSLTGNEPGIHVYDFQGIRRAAFGLGNNGPSLMFMTSSGVEISGLVTRKDGTTDLFLDKLGGGREKLVMHEQHTHTLDELFFQNETDSGETSRARAY